MKRDTILTANVHQLRKTKWSILSQFQVRQSPILFNFIDLDKIEELSSNYTVSATSSSASLSNSTLSSSSFFSIPDTKPTFLLPGDQHSIKDKTNATNIITTTTTNTTTTMPKTMTQL